MKKQSLSNIKKEFEKKFVGIPPMYHTEDHQNIQGYYSEKMLNIKERWSWIDSTISQTRQEVIEEIIIKIDLIIGRHKKEHQCRFNDGKQKCECYLEGLNRVKRQLHSQTK